MQTDAMTDHRAARHFWWLALSPVLVLVLLLAPGCGSSDENPDGDDAPEANTPAGNAAAAEAGLDAAMNDDPSADSWDSTTSSDGWGSDGDGGNRRVATQRQPDRQPDPEPEPVRPEPEPVTPEPVTPEPEPATPEPGPATAGPAWFADRTVPPSGDRGVRGWGSGNSRSSAVSDAEDDARLLVDQLVRDYVGNYEYRDDIYTDWPERMPTHIEGIVGTVLADAEVEEEAEDGDTYVRIVVSLETIVTAVYNELNRAFDQGSMFEPHAPDERTVRRALRNSLADLQEG